MPPSISSPTSVTSPKSLPPNPRINHFSALSPDHEPQQLPHALMSSSSAPPSSKPLIYYPRRSLLKIAQHGSKNGWTIPKDMSPLDAWFGSSTHPQMADPAIASIGPNARGAGFGEGFGFGGGIGGRSIGRGGRTLGTRRQNDNHHAGPSRDTIQGQMDRFIAKTERKADDRRNHNPVRREEPLRRDGEWRRQDPRPPNIMSRGPAEEAEPAWMDDSETFGNEDPAIAGTSGSDGLVHFVPGADMIAAHRNERHGGGKPLVSFFGAQPPPEPVKVPKTFNAADYLLPNKAVVREEPDEEQPQQAGSNAFQSRFQRFFGAAPVSAAPMQEELPPPRAYQSPPPTSETRPEAPKSPEGPDDHMARLMGLLQVKSSQTTTSSSPSNHPAPPGFDAPRQPLPPFVIQQQPLAHSHASVPDPHQAFFQDNRPYPPAGIDLSRRPPDAIQLLAHAQRPPVHMAHHPQMSIPPGMPAGLPDPRMRPAYPDTMQPRDLAHEAPFPREFHHKQSMPPHFQGPPGPPGYGPPMGMPMPPPMPQHLLNQRPPPPNLNSAQQDMLATLFAGLPRGPGQ